MLRLVHKGLTTAEFYAPDSLRLRFLPSTYRFDLWVFLRHRQEEEADLGWRETVNLTTIDVIGTVGRLLKAVLVEILLILAVLAFALSAPLLYTVGALWLAVNAPHEAEFWGMAYLLSGPIACGVWMSVLSHFPDWFAEWKARKAGGRIHRSFDERAHAFGRGLGFMFGGILGSFLAEGIVATAARCLRILPDHLVLFFSIAPFAVFAPCLLVVLRRWIRRDKYATA